MQIEIKIPSPGESVTVADIARWMVQDGEMVEKDQEVGEIESEKATLPLIAPASGRIKILVQAGNTVPVGTMVATIETTLQEKQGNEKGRKVKGGGRKQEAMNETHNILEAEAIPLVQQQKKPGESKNIEETGKVVVTPLARKKMEEYGLEVNDIKKSITRITRDEVENLMQQKNSALTDSSRQAERKEQHIRISALRKKLSERLVAAKNQTAMLTTFNEADMSALMEIRERFQKQFTEKYGVKIGYMSFFARAVAVALLDYPGIQTILDGDELIIPNYCDLGIAVQTDKGLMVPVIRNANLMSIPELETEIQKVAERARQYKLSIEEMTGGTFTITNGGVFGSLLSTPLLNPPQSAILGMHSIVKRPVAVNDQVVIRPMMYLALSYDHRVIDGQESVGFLLKIKILIENPYRLLTGGKSPEEVLLGI